VVRRTHEIVRRTFTILEARDRDLAEWYAHPEGTVASPADPERMRADGMRDG
jgi:hypothetical protein